MFIERYKVATGQYWLEPIHQKLVPGHSCTIWIGGAEVRRIPFSGNALYRLSASHQFVDDSTHDKIVRLLLAPTLPLWELLLLEAKDHLLRRRFREAVFSINGAFENYVNITGKKILSAVMTNVELDAYFGGHGSFEDFFLNEYISEERYNVAKYQGIIKNMRPTTYGIIKKSKMNPGLKAGLKKLNSVASNIRNNRNDIIHGNDNGETGAELVKGAIESFEIFIQIFRCDGEANGIS